MSDNKQSLAIKDFRSLELLLQADNLAIADNEYLFSRLQVGDVWWIPDELTHFSYKDGRPWVIVIPYQKGRPPAMACPRTTKKSSKGLLMQAGTLSAFDKDGWLLLHNRIAFPTADYKRCEYMDRLPPYWINQILRRLGEEV